MRLAIIREMHQIEPFAEVNSEFILPLVKIYNLDKVAEVCVQQKDFVSAMNKRTEICKNVTDIEARHLYVDVLRR